MLGKPVHDDQQHEGPPAVRGCGRPARAADHFSFTNLGDGNSGFFQISGSGSTLQFVAVPEPGTLALLAAAIACGQPGEPASTVRRVDKLLKPLGEGEGIAGRPGGVDQADTEHVAEVRFVFVTKRRELHLHERLKRNHSVGTK